MSDEKENINQIKKLIESTRRNLEKIESMVGRLGDSVDKPDYSDVPGVMGYFDGINLVGEDGNSYEVPANYAAKSRLVYGDKLKLIEQEGNKLFKQIEKVERKKCEGVLNKKEGKWYVITDSGSYRISDTAAEFNKVEVSDKAVVYIPAQNTNAALDKVFNKEPKPLEVTHLVKESTKEVSAIKQEKPEPKVANTSKSPEKLTARTSPPKPKSKPRRPQRKEYVQDISAPKTPKTPVAVASESVAPAVDSSTTTILEDDDLR